MPRMEKYLLSERTGREIIHRFGIASARQNFGLGDDVSFEDYWGRQDYRRRPPTTNYRSSAHSFLVWDEIKGSADGHRVFAALLHARAGQDWRPLFTVSLEDDDEITVEFNTSATDYSLFVNRRRMSVDAAVPTLKRAPWEGWPGKLCGKVPIHELSKIPYSLDARPKYRHMTQNLRNWFRAFWHHRFGVEALLPDHQPFEPTYAAANQRRGIAYWGSTFFSGGFEGCLAVFDVEVGQNAFMKPRLAVTVRDSHIHIDTDESGSGSAVNVLGVDFDG